MAFNISSTINKIRREEAKLIRAQKAIGKKLKGFRKILSALGGAAVGPKRRRKKMSKSARRKIAAAQRARWAKVRAEKKA